MAYSTITTLGSGGVPTTAQLNQMRDNFLSLYRWNSYGVHLSLTDDVTIVNATYQVLTWNKLEHQTGNMWSSGTNPSRITCQISGLYCVMATVEWHPNAGGERTMGIRKSGSTRFDLVSQTSGAGSGPECGLEVLHLAAADYIEIGVFHQFGANLDVRGAAKDRTNVLMFLMSNP